MRMSEGDPLAEPGMPALFVANDSALDFMNSVASPNGRTLDWIADGPGFAQWLRQSGLLSDEEMQEAERRLAPETFDAAAVKARSLRDWLRKAVVSRKTGRPAIDTAPLDAALSEHWSRPVFGGRVWSRQLALRSPMALLGPVAQAIGDLLISADFDRVRPCEGAGCTLWFLDISKTNRRRWCSMAVCGNRAKLTAHRARQRAG